jgi:hypothetical protein
MVKSQNKKGLAAASFCYKKPKKRCAAAAA